MNDMFCFDRADWELLVDALKPGSTLSAISLLSALEAENEPAAEEALDALAEKRITIDISALPADYGSGEIEKRLRFEARLTDGDALRGQLAPDDPLYAYLQELAAIPAAGDSALLSRRAAAGDEEARQKMLNLYLHRVADIACEYTGRGILLLDLMQEAGLGLWQAILRYEGGSFDEQADWWMRQSICRMIVMQARESGILRSVQKNMEAYQTADKQLLAELGRNATVEEIAVELGVTAEQATVIRDMLLNASAVDKIKGARKDQEQEDALAVEDTAYFQSRQRVDELLSGLTEEEAKIISLRFGLEGGVPMSAEAVGSRLGSSSEQILAIEAAALNKLRNG